VVENFTTENIFDNYLEEKVALVYEAIDESDYHKNVDELIHLIGLKININQEGGEFPVAYLLTRDPLVDWEEYPYRFKQGDNFENSPLIVSAWIRRLLEDKTIQTHNIGIKAIALYHREIKFLATIVSEARNVIQSEFPTMFPGNKK
jgi:hypothetical protein